MRFQDWPIAIIAASALASLITPCFAQGNPPPPPPAPGSTTVTSFSPNAIEQGKTAQIRIKGTNFLPGCTALWNGQPVTTAWITSNEVVATVKSEESGPIYVQVQNPSAIIPGTPGTPAGPRVPAAPPIAPQVVPQTPATASTPVNVAPSAPTAYSVSIGYRAHEYSTLLGAVGNIGSTKVLLFDKQNNPQLTWALGGIIAGGTQSGSSSNSGQGTAGFGLGPRFLFGKNNTFTLLVGGYVPIISGGTTSGGIGNPELLGSLSFSLTTD